MSIFGFLSAVNPNIAINFSGRSSRPLSNVNIPDHHQYPSNNQEVVVFASDESICGTVDISVPAGKRIEHLGIKVELIGQIEQSFNRGNNVHFLKLVRELEPCGVLTEPKKYLFEFATEKPYESYNGTNIQLRYFVKVTLSRNYGNNLSQEKELFVKLFQNLSTSQLLASHDLPVRMEVGIEDCLHIEFEYDKPAYHLSDTILGKIHFSLIRIKIKNMELCIVRREMSTGNGSNVYTESESIIRYELMDGVPTKGECIPLRLFLSPLRLTPTYRSVHDLYSVKYYLNLVLIDEEDRRYFKQQEVVFYRKCDE